MNNNDFVLYLHVAPNGKKYFGITKQKPKQRWQSGHGYRKNNHFWNAIKLYGWYNIEHYILADDLTEKEACFFEKVMIALYKSNNPDYGYNITGGGDHPDMAEETKQKLSEAHKGKHHSEASKQKISKSMTGEKNHRYGKTGFKCPNSKTVICLTTKQLFGSTREAGRKMNISNGCISKCCRGGNCKSSGKTPDGTPLVWRYLNYKHDNVYHIVGGYYIDNERIARLIEESFGVDVPIDYDNLPDII